MILGLSDIALNVVEDILTVILFIGAVALIAISVMGSVEKVKYNKANKKYLKELEEKYKNNK